MRAVVTEPNDGLLWIPREKRFYENACFFLATSAGVRGVYSPLELVRESRYHDLGHPVSDEDPQHLRTIRRVSLILSAALLVYQGRHVTQGSWQIDLTPFMIISPPQIVQRRGELPQIIRLVTDGTHFELIKTSKSIFTHDPPREKWKEIERAYRLIMNECVYSDDESLELSKPRKSLYQIERPLRRKVSW